MVSALSLLCVTIVCVMFCVCVMFTTSVYKIPHFLPCLLYTSPSPRDLSTSRMPSSA